MTVSQRETFDVMRPIFQKAVDICKSLLQRNHLSSSELEKLILVGGPTHCPLIRQMLRDQITPNVDTSVDPMTVVATGAALYASTIDADVSSEEFSSDTVMLELSYEATSVEKEEWVSVQLSADSSRDNVLVELVRSDKAWSSGRVEIDKTGNVINAALLESRPNSFEVVCYDVNGNRLPCFPNEITIIQGSKVGAAPLPYNIGIAVWDTKKKRAVFRMATGLEKNKPVPATGVINGLKTTSELRPGVESDIIRVPIYQVDDFKEAVGRPVSLYEYVGDVLITGDDVEGFTAEGTAVDITLKVDTSEQMLLEIYFPNTDTTIDKPLDTGKKHSIAEAEKEIDDGLADARRTISQLRDDGIATDELEAALRTVEDEAANSSEKKMVLQHLKEVLRKIEDKNEGTEWERLESKLRDKFADLERAQEDLGDEKTARQVDELRRNVDSVIRQKDVKAGNEIIDRIGKLYVQLTLVYQCMYIIRDYNASFDSEHWKDWQRARALINQGLSIMNDKPTSEKLLPIAQEILRLLPDEDKANARGLLG
ncbi:MAG: Hsp70 family protein, partial [Prevotella sp.]|nr:Hsp70 family protein [Prevotella sp.]